MHNRAASQNSSGYSNTFTRPSAGTCNTGKALSSVRALTPVRLETRITQRLYAAFSMRNEEWDNNPLKRTCHYNLAI